MLKHFLLSTVGVMVAASMGATAANALIIDDFTDHLENTNVCGSPADADCDGVVMDITSDGNAVFDRSVQMNGTIIGGDRELLVNKLSDEGAVIAQITPLPVTGMDGDIFRHNNSGGPGTSLLRWDGTEGDTDGLDFNLGGLGMGMDLSSDMTGQLHISVVQADLAGSSISLTFYTDAANYSMFLVNLPAGPSEFFFPLADIAASNPVGSGVNLMDVRAIELFADGAAAFDVGFDIVDTIDDVPEPASLALLGAGILGLGAIKRRRKAA